MKAIYVYKTGGPENLTLVDISDPIPQDNEVLVNIKAIGVNFIDIYYRRGIYPADLPIKLGLEASGIVEKIGKAVKDFKPNDRVVYTSVFGSYAQKSVVPADRLIKLPDQLSFKEGAAAILQGITAQYLTSSTYPLKKDDICLIHAAAGGVGLLLCQVAKLIGAIVIGTVSTEEKAQLAKKAGANHVILYTKQDVVAEVKKITAGNGVNVVYDNVGKDTFDKSLACLAPRGMLVLFGQSSGAVAPFDLSELSRRGSLYVTRPGINAYIATREELLWRASEVFTWLNKGMLKLNIHHEFLLENAQQAHESLEGRKTTGKVLLIP